MGTLRFESTGPSVGEDQYQKILNALREARAGSEDFEFFWNLEEGEDWREALRQFEYVARLEQIPLQVHVYRKAKRLQIIIAEPKPKNSIRKVKQEAIRSEILALLSGGGPMKPKDIIAASGLTAAQWQAGIYRLMKEGTVIQEGRTRNTTYRLHRKSPREH